jgi:TonB-dependent receptor
MPSLHRALIVVALALVSSVRVHAQQAGGRVVGRVLDAAQGSPIHGATVEVVGTSLRGTTSIDGRYTLLNVPAGPVSVSARYIGYSPKTVTGLVVKAGGVVEQDISLANQVIQLQEVTVTAEAERGSVNRALDEQRNAPNIVNAITAEQIKKSPDGDAAQAIQRVSGVTVQDGKYVFVRGLGERYTTTSLNGARIPSPEPERKVVPLDLFPSGLLESITTSKTFTPDQPGDFSGASVNLKTREFTAGRVATITLGAGFNDAATGKTVYRAPRVGQEWLGFAGSARQLPPLLQASPTLQGLTQQQTYDIIGSFRNVWSSRTGTGAPNGSFSAAVGGEDPLFGQLFSYAGSLSYSIAQEVKRDETKGLVRLSSTPGTALPLNTYTGQAGRISVLWGGLFNLSTRIGSGSKLSLNNTYTRTADNDVEVLNGNNEEFSQFNPLTFTRLTFTERAVRSNQLLGEHLLGKTTTVDWQVTNAHVSRNEPDRSDIAYTSTFDPTTGAYTPRAWPGVANFATRTFSKVGETNWDGNGSVKFFLGNPSNPAVLKVGGGYRYTTRDAASRAYDLINNSFTDQELRQPPEQLFTPANAQAGKLVLNANSQAGRYTAEEHIGAGFVQLELPFSSRLQLVGGARVENWRLDVTSFSVTGLAVPAKPRKTDVLPSLALNYHLTDDQNLRLSATQTLSRPEYRELSTVPYFEQVGLATTFGNPKLRRALIQNLDLRWEWFPRAGEVISLGVFYKNFNSPIEKIIVQTTGANSLSFVNADKARNYGVELELRKGIGGGFSVFANTTLMKSSITPGNDSISGLTNANRPMVGQSEYVANGGLSWSTWGGALSATALYNVVGRRIIEAGVGGLPDAYEEARHLVDFSIQFPILRNLGAKLDGRNLLDAPFRVLQGGVIRQRFTAGRVISAAFSWRP